MLEMEGKRHQALRKLLQRDFSVPTLRRYDDFLRGSARMTVDAALQPNSSCTVRGAACGAARGEQERSTDATGRGEKSSAGRGGKLGLIHHVTHFQAWARCQAWIGTDGSEVC